MVSSSGWGFAFNEPRFFSATSAFYHAKFRALYFRDEGAVPVRCIWLRTMGCGRDWFP
jgi:hypothetical protein